MCIYVQDMKFLWLNLLLGGLSTDDANDNNDATQWTIHDCIGSSAISKWANKIWPCNGGHLLQPVKSNYIASWRLIIVLGVINV